MDLLLYHAVVFAATPHSFKRQDGFNLKKNIFSIKFSETKRISTCSVFGIILLVSPKDVSPDLILKLVLEPATAVRVLNYRLQTLKKKQKNFIITKKVLT